MSKLISEEVVNERAEYLLLLNIMSASLTWHDKCSFAVDNDVIPSPPMKGSVASKLPFILSGNNSLTTYTQHFNWPTRSGGGGCPQHAP